jgi:hypothetical protein
VRQVDGTYLVSNVIAYEGNRLSYKQVISETNRKRISIPNPNVDTSLIKVSVASVASPTEFLEFQVVDNVLDADSATRGFFIEEVDNGLYDIVFGDGVLLQSLEIGDIVNVSYFVTNAELANSLSVLSLETSIDGITSAGFVYDGKSSGGAPEESIESVRVNAPLFRETYQRAVTPPDYEVLIKKLFPIAGDVKAVGGEKVLPPKFGTVVIFVKPLSANFLTSREKGDLIAFLEKYKTVLSKVEIADPEYTYVIPQVNIEADTKKTSQSAGEIEDAIEAGIIQYSNDRFEKFNAVFRQSNFISYVDKLFPYIISSATRFSIEKRIFATLKKNVAYEFSFAAEVDECTLISTEFSYNGIDKCFFNEELGILKIMTLDTDGVARVVNSNAGTLDLSTGKMKILSIAIDSIPEDDRLYDESYQDYYIRFQVSSRADYVGKNEYSIVKIESPVVTVTKTSGVL